jgi:hypothetical protein
MPSLKGLACVSLFALAVITPAFAQSGDTPAPASRVPTISPTNPSAQPGDQQNSPKVRKHHRRSRNRSAIQQSQPANPQ